MTSLSLWVMKRTVLPVPTRKRIASKSPSIPCGVKTEVGSSRMMMSAPL